MIPKGDRDDIEREVYLKDGETNFNFELSRIAGEKFFCWIQDLVKSGKYDYDSIFSLIPNFEKCKKETDEKYAEFIDNFKEGFENKLQDTDIIPVLIDRAIDFKLVSEIIYDKTGLSCSGIMTDDEILSMSNLKDYFPHPLLRNYEKVALSQGIKSFLDLYHDDSQIYDKDTLHEAVENTPFQKWLESPNNNEKFLGFLLNKRIIDYFSDSPIFLSESGDLYKPEDLYYDIDDYYEDISYLDSYLSRLSLRTRKFCEDNKDWNEFKDKFKSFDPDEFVDKVLLDSTNEDDVHELLSQPEASVHFMHFLSQHVGFSDKYKRFPFVDSDGKIVENFTDPALIFTPSKDAELLCTEKWIDNEWIVIISSAYDEDSQKYLLDNFGVQQYENKIIIENIICANKYQDDINTNLDSFEVSKSFVDFTFKNREYINDGALSGYYVSAIDKQGEENYISEDENYIYIRNKIYNEVESQDWFDKELMYSLNEAYYKDSSNTAEFKKFFEDKFDIPTITEKLLLEDIILKQESSINDNIEDEANNISFWRWVKAFAKDQATIQKFNIFNLLVKELNENEYSVSTIEATGIYLSNAYQSSSDIETIVKKYAPDALFVASDYLEDCTSSTIKEWVKFLSDLGVKTTIEELVFSKIIPNVGDIEEEGLPILLGQYYDQIQEKWDERLENNKMVKSYLKSIYVKTKDGEFTLIEDCIIVDVAKDKEPFRFIELDNEIAESISSDRNAKKLLLDISKEAGGKVISDVTKWQEWKLSEYAGNEDQYSIDTHIQFMEELSLIDIETLKTFESIKSLQLLDEDDEYQTPSELTLSSAYKTSCQFDKNGATEGLNFISRRYVEINEEGCFVEMTKKVLKIHYRFEKEDIPFLSNFKFAVYFWSEYALKHLEFVEGLIEDGEFENMECVPTLAGNVYAPEEVYSPKIKEYVVKKISGWEDKVLSDEIPEVEDENKDLISKLGLKQQLSFEDGLNALITIKSKEKRQDILEWMNEDYNDAYNDMVSAYRSREDSIWKNGKAEDKHISELYAIDPNSKTLREFFRDNEFVLHSDYIPMWDSEKYISICNMMQIPIIEESEMEFNPVDSQNDSRAPYFEGRLLIVAGIEDLDNWQTKFSEYKKKIDTMSFWRCTSISWTYKENPQISQSNKKFYAYDESFYYVKDWCTKQVYTDFVRKLYELLGCKMNEDNFSTILDPDEKVSDILENYYSIRTDEFLTELAKYHEEYAQYSGRKVSDEVEEEDDTIESSTPYCPQKIDGFQQEDKENKNTEYTSKSEENTSELEYDEPQEKTSITEHSFEVLLDQKPKSEPEEDEFHEFATDEGQPIGGISNDVTNYEPVGIRPTQQHKPRSFTKEETNRMRSNGTPLELESLSATEEEQDALSQCGISPEQIADTNYLAQLRLYRNLKYELGEEPEESMSEFVRNANDVSEHKMKSGKYIHACSAARGVMYVSPSVWNKMLDNKWIICVYLDGMGKNFHYINTADEFLELVQKDDVVIKITGKEKVEVVNELYSGILENVKGTAYTLVRVAARTNMDAAFAHYVGAMAERNDGNDTENPDEY